MYTFVPTTVMIQDFCGNGLGYTVAVWLGQSPNTSQLPSHPRNVRVILVQCHKELLTLSRSHMLYEERTFNKFMYVQFSCIIALFLCSARTSI